MWNLYLLRKFIEFGSSYKKAKLRSQLYSKFRKRPTFWKALVGHCEKKKFKWTYAWFWMVTEEEMFESTNKKCIVNGNKGKEIAYCKFHFSFNWKPKWQICYTEITNLLQFKSNVRKSYQQLQYTFATRLRGSRVVRLSFFTFLHDGSSTQDVSDQFVSSIHLSWVKSLFIEPHKQNSNGVRSWALGGHCTGPPRSFLRPGNISFRYCITGRIECGEAPSW
jgi:hypothetical protein